MANDEGLLRPPITLNVTLHRIVGHRPGFKQSMAVDSSHTIQQLAAEVAAGLKQAIGLYIDVALLINPGRNQVAPFHNTIGSHFDDGDTVAVVGSVHANAIKDIAQDSHLIPSASAAPLKVPVTILTGFLGAGKTTLLNYLLREQRDRRIAVIENEFGEVPIDNELLSSKLSTAEQVVVMDNGCMCCTVRGDLLGAFNAVAQQAEKSGRPLDAVLVETTGMADPVPIVRTFMQTPAIHEKFSMEGVVTLVDSKNILKRLKQMDEVPSKPGGPVDEAFQQIAFADRIVLSKIDLVPATEAVEVYKRVREINGTAGILTCVRGHVDPGELTGPGAFKVSAADFMEEDHSHGHGEHDCCHEHAEGHSHAHAHEHGTHCEEEGRDHGNCGHEEGDHHHHEHAHAESRHNKQVNTFSLLRPGQEVDPLKFARWVRTVATLPQEDGQIYRIKAVLAAAGNSRKVVFHAVSDVMEKEEAGEWAPGEARGCKIVFIGRNLDRPLLEGGFDGTLRTVRTVLRPAGGAQTAPADLLSRLSVAAPAALCQVLLNLSTRDACRLGLCSGPLADWAAAEATADGLRAAAAASKPPVLARHPEELSGLYLHPCVPLTVAGAYHGAAKGAKLVMGRGGATFSDAAEVEAAGVMWLELCDLDDSQAVNYLVEFGWREQTLATFFQDTKSSTSSGMVKVTYEAEWEEDELKFRVLLQPDTTDDPQPMAVEGTTAAAQDVDAAIPQHKMIIQLVGGRSASQVYQLAFHSVNPTYQVHVNVEDHRQPMYDTNQRFHKWHPLMAQLQRVPRLRCLVRIKPGDGGPLDNMCGCC